MNCADFEKLILLQDSGELPDAERQVLADHLNGCSPCRDFRSQLAVIRTTLRQESTSLAEGPPARVLDAIHEAAARHRPRERWGLATPWRGIWAAAASLALCFLGVRFFLNQGAVPPAPVSQHDYATEMIPLVSLVMGKEAMPAHTPGDTALGILANQLLMLQDMNGEAQDDVAEEFNLYEDMLPTTLQWHSTREPLPGRYG